MNCSRTSNSTASYKLARVEKAKRLARRGLLPFTLFTKPDYEVSWHHARLCAFIDAFFADRTAQIAIVNMPPQHGKSELVSRRLPAYLLGKDPDLPILACSHTGDLAGSMNRDVQRIIDDERYSTLFPDTYLAGRNVRNDSSGNYLRNSEMFEPVGRRGYYRSAGVGGNIVGRGFRVGLIDDPHKSREDVDSPTMRSRVWKWFTGDFLTRRGPGWKLLLVQTRWHREDLAGKILQLAADYPTAFGQPWLLCLKAVCEEEAEGDPRKPGEALWPSRYPLEDLAKIKAANGYDWASQYQQNPRPEGGVEWPDDYFGSHIWFNDWPSRLTVRVMALDPSKGKSDKVGDYSAFVLLGLDAAGCLWVDADLERRPISRNPSDPGPSIIRDGLDLFQAFQPKAFGVEINGFQETLKYEFDRERKARGVHGWPVYGFNNTVNKQVRIRTLGPWFAQRKIRIHNTPGGRLLVQQLRDFPVGDHDDGPDALEMAVRLLLFLLGEKPERDEPGVLEI